jgi:hypothetical protein
VPPILSLWLVPTMVAVFPKQVGRLRALRSVTPTAAPATRMAATVARSAPLDRPSMRISIPLAPSGGYGKKMLRSKPSWMSLHLVAVSVPFPPAQRSTVSPLPET